MNQRLLSQYLKKAHGVSKAGVLKGAALNQREREFLIANGWLVEVLRGWYFLAKPEHNGSTALWQGHYSAFLSYYLSDRFGEDYCLGPENSLDFWAGKTQTTSQFWVITKRGGAGKVDLAFGSSLFVQVDSRYFPEQIVQTQGINVMPPAVALAKVSPAYFTADTLGAQIVLKITAATDISRALLLIGKQAPAARIVGALEAMQEFSKAESIKDALTNAGWKVRSENPFEMAVNLIGTDSVRDPYSARIKAMWGLLRQSVIDNFPSPENIPSKEGYLARSENAYKLDAYHSLSIEGYAVTSELIETVISGAYFESPEAHRNDTNALAARGYYQAFKTVIASIGKILDGQDAGTVVDKDLQTWYAQLFDPCVKAKIIEAYALAGYRDRAVFIDKAQHVPPPKDAVPGAMETLFALLKAEAHPAVRAILGHFTFVFIHPYSDGNGRIGRFLMNAMLASGGYPWTVVRVEHRAAYMAALEDASVRGNIAPFTRFVADEMLAAGISTKEGNERKAALLG